MNCAQFEQGLASLMAGDVPQVRRDENMVALRRHAGGCAECEGTLDLLTVLDQPAGERDVVDPPAAEYWDDFDHRLKARIEADAGTDGSNARSGRWRAAALAAAATLVFGMLGLWLMLRPGGPRPASNDIAAIELPGDVVAMLSVADPDAVVGGLAGMTGELDASWMIAGLDDIADDADEIGYGPAWTAVEQAAQRAGAGATPTIEQTWNAGVGAAADLADEAADLGPEQMRQLLEWLERETAAVRGVS